jgi:hypothetical protein
VAKAFDATLNTLIDDHVSDWAAFLAARCGVPPGPATVLDTEATATDLTGQLDINGANGAPYLTFRYTVVRVWQESLAALLAAGTGLLPLALLTNEAATDLPAAFGLFQQ